MNTLIHLSLNDWRITFRDPMMKLFLVMPFFTFLFIRFGWPILSTNFPFLQDHSLLVLMWACTQVASMFGFIYGFLFLEEKEEHVWSAIRILPVSVFQLTLSRLMVGVLIGTLTNFTIIHWGGLMRFPIYQEILLAFHFSFIAPVIAMAIAVFAQNRIEGLAQTKIVNLVTIIPGLLFILPYKALHLFAIIPTYWSFKSMEAAALNQSLFWLFYILGLAFYLLCIWWMSGRLARQ